ncbi:MAG: serine/threonine-protein kinase [Verrucomicrobiaceae bacterium]
MTRSGDSHCQSCGAPLDPTVLGGSCPACVWAGLIGGEEEERKSLEDAPEVEGYEILEEIGQGGMGVVYRARQETPAREVALKMVAPYSLRAAQARERFLLEVEAMAAVEHPGLLPLYDAGEDRHGRPWLTMQLAQGGSLADRITSYSGKWKESARLVTKLCEAMHFAHERGILHRDLKPANILFDREDHVYIADFGLAKWAEGDSGLTHQSSMLGSPAYLAPEAAREGSKRTTTVSDVYGLGAVLYELLVGAKPYEGSQPAEVLTQILDGSPLAPRKRLKNIPRDLEVIVLKAMAREPERRYHSAAAFAEDLGLWLEGKAIRARPVGLVERGVIWVRRNPAVATLSVLFLGSLVTGGVLLWRSNQELTASLDDVEGRVEFMTRELPASLAPVGRMDVLDEVFLNVSEYFEKSRRKDAESLARHADFLTQWAHTLKDRGQTETMIGRLEQAVAKADEAVAAGEPTVRVARARVAAGWRLGEVLIYSGVNVNAADPSLLKRAREVLNETVEFAEEFEFDDLRYRVLKAQLASELTVLETEARETKTAVGYGERARVMWGELQPLLEADGESKHAQLALMAAADVHLYLGQAYHYNGDAKEGGVSFGDWMEARRKLAEGDPGNPVLRRNYAHARRLSIEWGGVVGAEGARVLGEVDEEYEFLMSRDPANVVWRTEAVAIARLLAENARGQGDEKGYLRWMEVVAERLLPLYKMEGTTFLKMLTIRRHEAAHCGLAFESVDWAKAFLHFDASVRTQVRIAGLMGEAEEARLGRMVGRVKVKIEDHEGSEAAEKWAKKYQTN